MYRVIAEFKDGKDNQRLYKIGDKYPAKATVKADEKRIAELKGNNTFGKAFIEEVKEKKD